MTVSGQGASAPEQTTTPPDAACDAPPGTITVNPDNVLELYRIIQDQADWLTERIGEHAPSLRIEQMGADPVSRDAASAFNHRLADGPDSYVARAREYALDLHQVAHIIRQNALAYGYSEDEIAQGFPNGDDNDPQPPCLRPMPQEPEQHQEPAQHQGPAQQQEPAQPREQTGQPEQSRPAPVAEGATR